MTPIIELHDVTKRYRLHRGKRALLGRGGIFERGQRGARTFAAIDGLCLTVDAGEAIGIIGRNGSGKSTLLKMLAGVTLPSSGHIAIRGRVASLLELGAGFHSMLTGRENVYLNAGLLGMRHAETRRVFDQIVDFSGIAEFIDQTVDTYSSGMYVRLAFSVAVHTNPDIFLVDEVLAVGDEDFQRRCRTKIGELKELGKTICFVSHDLGMVSNLCDRVVLLDRGRMLQRPSPQQTIEYYLRQIGRQSGVHTIRAGDLEAVFCHGRISLFRGGHEITAPQGIQMQFLHLGSWHQSSNGDWELEERSERHFRARGKMMRLPLTAYIECGIAEGRIEGRFWIQFEPAVAPESMDVIMFWPRAYSHWFYGDLEGVFPELQPGHQGWVSAAPADWTVREAGMNSTVNAALPRVSAKTSGNLSGLRVQWSNSDYLTGARVLQMGARLSEGDRSDLAAGGPCEASVAVSLSIDPPAEEWSRDAAARRAARVVEVAGLSARFESGAIELYWRNVLLTVNVHLHTEIYTANYWLFSQYLGWGGIEKNGTTLARVGETRRFPFKQRWELSPGQRGICFRVWFEVTEPFSFEEYNISLSLGGAYTHWALPQEAGVFPEPVSEANQWRHLNKDFRPAPWIQASGPSVPNITMSVNPDRCLVHMTALNGAAGQQERVLQAIATPGQRGLMQFAPGKHLAFDGEITATEGDPLER